jgi:hypothetical protein
MFTRVLRSADAVHGGSAKTAAAARAAEPLEVGGVDGTLPDLRSTFPSALSALGPLDDDQIRVMLDDCSKFLWQLTHITSSVVETIDLGHLRKIVAAECPVPPNVIGDDGKRGGSAPAEPDRDHRKNPRGRKHPVITLLQMALQGVRLLLQITSGTHPNAHDKESLEEKQQREKLKEQERTFNKLLSGRM